MKKIFRSYFCLHFHLENLSIHGVEQGLLLFQNGTEWFWFNLIEHSDYEELALASSSNV